MNSGDLLATIYTTRQVQDAEGRAYPLHSEITPDEGALLASLIKKHGSTRTLEIGCAYGLSSLYICGAITGDRAASHVIIDPYQGSEWHNIGIANLRRASLSCFELIEEPSELALPRLLRQDKKFDFALIDGYHTFDQTLVDFYFVDRLLEPNGVVVLDDVHLPAVRKVARFIAKLPNYRAVGGARQFRSSPSWGRRAVTGLLRLFARMLPKSFSDDVFADGLHYDDLDLGVGHEMVAFMKTGTDQRGTHAFVQF
ncbi:MAG: class I SAM-dependent methyltransferase [Gemmataceae bacterium]|nr:class I SAM-dependent methyltransferase [Gemmataceae bacterium]